jgi:hypothetical protein
MIELRLPLADRRIADSRQSRFPDLVRVRRPPRGMILVVLGSLNFFWGLAGILENENLIVGGQGVIIVDFTAWGWAMLIIGAIQVAAGLGLT